MKSTALNASNVLISILIWLAIICIPLLILAVYYFVGSDVASPLNLELGYASVKFNDALGSPVLVISTATVILIELVLGIMVLFKVRQFLNSIGQAKYFTQENVERLRSIGIWLIVICGIYFGSAFVIAIVQGQFELSISLTTIVTMLSIAIIFVLADIFKQGARIQNDQDLTI